METPAERLQWARRRAGYDDATSAARAFGWKVSTYLGHEAGDRVPKRDLARRYARAYRTRWEWLLEGEGSPDELNGDSGYQERLVVALEAALSMFLKVDRNECAALVESVVAIAKNPPTGTEHTDIRDNVRIGTQVAIRLFAETRRQG
jgi:hypothetical protein